jgi:hypothetical protein
MFAVYLLAIPLVTAWAMMHGLRHDKPEMVRCAAVILAHAIVIQVANMVWPPIEGQGYAWPFITASLVGVLWLICRVPATRVCAMLAGSVLFGILVSLIYGVSTTLQGHQIHSDWSYFWAQFTMGWANLAILLGWIHERGIRRVADRVGRWGAVLVQQAYRGGLAR